MPYSFSLPVLLSSCKPKGESPSLPNVSILKPPPLQLYYCNFSSSHPAAITLSLVWLFNLFVALAIAADDFFCPSLAVISKSLRLSQNVAGVTILAFGNGAPDIFSSLAGIQQARPGKNHVNRAQIDNYSHQETVVAVLIISIRCRFFSGPNVYSSAQRGDLRAKIDFDYVGG